MSQLSVQKSKNAPAKTFLDFLGQKVGLNWLKEKSELKLSAGKCFMS
jgi:hypothetical protein